MKFYDTCSIMEDNADLSDVIISSITIQELENIKTGNRDKETKSKARSAVRAIKAQKPLVVIYNPLWDKFIQDENLELTNDNKIIISASITSEKYDDFCFYTEDYLAWLIATSIYKLDVRSAKETAEIYKGYKRVIGDTNHINRFFEMFNAKDWYVNEYLITYNTDTDEWKEARWDGEQFVPLILPKGKGCIKGKNSEQRCAIDALNNEDIDIVAILGGYGSGKTYLCTQMALYHIDHKGTTSKIIGVRSPESESKEVGYLKGTLEDKTELFFKPLEDSLEGGDQEFERLKREGRLQMEIPYYLKGRTFTDSIMVCDEAEDFSEPEIKLIGTRAGDRTKIFWCGDYKQAVMNKSTSNPLAIMCSKLRGKDSFACVCLEKDVRSNVSRLYSEVYDD